MRIAIVGTGYVGLVSGTCFANSGNTVTCLDINAEKIARLNRGEIPIYEPGLEELVVRNAKAGRLLFTTDTAAAIQTAQVIFLAVGTPPSADGSADLSSLWRVVDSIAPYLDPEAVVVTKSTVPVGTADKVRAAIAEALTARGVELEFSVVSNPEFLKEGAAVEDFMRPDRVVIGAEDERAIELMRQLYAPFQRNHDRVLVMDIKSAELTKYAANAMLATRISFMNELALLAERVGADIERVRLGIGSDTRIGYSFLYAGCGYGGSCFPKDVKALVRTAAELGHDLKVLNAVEAANDAQKQVLPNKVVQSFGEDLSGRHFAVWGLAFKPNTDDMREASSRVLIADLVRRGATVSAHDPVAMDEATRVLALDLGADASKVQMCETPMAALQGADALLIVTEWKAFRSPDFDAIKASLKSPVIFDGRNLYEPAAVRDLGFDYQPIGR